MDILTHVLDFFLHINAHLADIFARYGVLTYTILFLIVFCETGLVVMPWLPGDSLLFAAGALTASTGQLDIYVLIVLLIAAALTGDNVNYVVGRFLGQKIKAREKIGFFKREYIERTEAYYEQYGGRTVIIARFVPLVRTVAPFVAGAGNMCYVRYLGFCIGGAMLWVGGLTMLGYQFGNLEIVQKNFELVILSIVAISLLPIVHQIWKNFRSKTSETASV
ncbi:MULTISPECIES: DedA family protein [Methylomicrobium]|uniref:Putative membrane-associated protein n=1 Tax=Methylomicrobium album BG8 TaxID=686340 RepID=H8GGX7_METAL|nr:MULTISPECIES: DedA family protein [Methylomicrobium]EIC31252.1 putative membrane-associated protein [Methylomicrobium album BG8]